MGLGFICRTGAIFGFFHVLLSGSDRGVISFVSMSYVDYGVIYLFESKGELGVYRVCFAWSMSFCYTHCL